MRFQTVSRTDVGRVRKRNEDSVGYFKPTESDMLRQYGMCLAVADGVGGEAHGDVASRTAIAALLKDYYKGPGDVPVQQRLKNSVAKANAEVMAAADELRSRGTATTLVAAIILADRAVIANVGDSRAYVINRPRAKIRQISLDHSLVQEQVRMGILTAEEAEQAPNKNVITRALGTDPTVKVDIFEVPLVAGDTVLLCSDGLVRVVSDVEIANIVGTNALSIAVDKLIALANSRGGPDNISICAAGTDGAFASAVLPIVAAAAVVVVVGTVLLLGGRLADSWPFRELRGRARIEAKIESNPSGAAITINGESIGTTPFETAIRLLNARDGKLNIRLSLDGYVACDDTVAVKELQKNDRGLLVLDKKYPLVANPIMVALSVTSVPDGAQVFLDGTSIGTAPIEGYLVAAGAHKLRLALTGYEEYEESLIITESEEMKPRVITLTKRVVVSAQGTLSVESTPSGARISVDDKDTGKSTPATFSLTLGTHAVKLAKDGYKSYDGSVQLTQMEASKELSITLDKILPTLTTGTLSVTSTPEGAEVTIDGTLKGATPILGTQLGIGEHTIRVSMRGYAPREEKCTIVLGKETTLNVTLVALKDQQSVSVRFESSPPGARVWIDDVDSGKVTPCELPLKLGIHKVTTLMIGYANETTTVTILEDKVPDLVRFELKPVPGSSDPGLMERDEVLFSASSRSLVRVPGCGWVVGISVWYIPISTTAHV